MDIVIGHSGFIGTHLVAELVRRGTNVRGYDLQDPPADSLGRLKENVVGDILNKERLFEAVHRCETVYHLAGNPQLWDRRPAAFDQVHRQGTVNVLEAAKRSGVRRLVYTGTESILVPRRHEGPITEDVQPTLKDMLGPYCRSKFLAEQAVLRAAADGFPAVVVSPTMPVGPGDRNLTPPGRMIFDFLRGNLPGYISGVLNFVDVRDVAVGHVLAADRGTPGRRYILAGHDSTLKAFFFLLSRVSGRSAPRLRVPYAAALAWSILEECLGRISERVPRSSVTGVRLCRRNLSFDGSQTWEFLGHNPRPLEDTVRDAVGWFQEQPDGFGRR